MSDFSSVTIKLATFGVIVPEIPKYFWKPMILMDDTTSVQGFVCIQFLLLPRKHKVVIVFLFIRIKS